HFPLSLHDALPIFVSDKALPGSDTLDHRGARRFRINVSRPHCSSQLPKVLIVFGVELECQCADFRVRYGVRRYLAAILVAIRDKHFSQLSMSGRYVAAV